MEPERRLPDGLIVRAAGLASDWPKPLSVMCQFLAAGQFREVTIKAVSLRKTRVAEALRITMLQDDKPLVEALVWTGDTVEGYQHDVCTVPDVPHHDELKTLDQLVPNLQTPYPFFNNYTLKPVNFVPFTDRENLPPHQVNWYRFAPDGDYSDPYVNAGRFLVLLDTFGWTAASQAHKDDPSFMGPTLSLSVDFHRFDSCNWLLCESSSDIAEHGLIGVRNRVFSDQRQLLASASGTLICRKRQTS